jgi:Na+/H+-dicarboxylate symporter
MMQSLSARVLVALILGISAGAAIQAWGGAGWAQAVDVIAAVGGLWLNALRMTVVPLVFALMVTGVASVADAAATGRLAARAVGLFTILIFGAAIYGTAMIEFLLALWPVDPAAARAFVAGAAPADSAAVAPPSFTAWLQSIAPPNPLRAAANDEILALVVFAVLFGFAATRLEAHLREPLVNFFRAVSEAMIVIVRWVLTVAPIGVFALSLAVGARAGFGAAGVLVQYVTLVSLSTIGIIVVAYLLAMLVGRVPLGRFARATAPATVVAFSTQSSLATLPAMIECARSGLGVPARIVDLVLPLAVAVFRFTSPVANLAVAYFIAHVSGIEPTPMQMIGAIFAAFAASVAAVGLPGQVSFFVSMAPICIALGVPLDLLAILLAVEVVPDIFRTVGNVMGDLAATTILNRRESAVAAGKTRPEEATP